ncbi:hypothetical protein CEUSTIGMA_g4261.t1 [Chlamydomonas eustigma]|uniref:Uncharacterized protein n=1 Tax=Chlamydomonas eustigma TaxID=1157962 RepID=A0A250X184_9CHLO|nr:hypothetical protein CEUSTIGMA_g4261.t1 [Chlamydomonas eustigma]|eukprot:GAX76815.1 hypothetical protein CEUSTIGMA_g4261.t1 [Chlamydomonas eustigma]
MSAVRSCVVFGISVPIGYLHKVQVSLSELRSRFQSLQALDELDMRLHELYVRDKKNLQVCDHAYDSNDESLERTSKDADVSMEDVQGYILASFSFLNKAFHDKGGQDDVLLHLLSSANKNNDEEQLSMATMLQSCELWLTAPCLIPMRAWSMEDLTCDLHDHSDRYGTMASCAARNECLVAKGVELMRTAGMVLLPDSLTVHKVQEVGVVAREHIARAEKAVKRKAPDIRLGTDLFAFKEFASRGIQRFDLLLDETLEGTAAMLCEISNTTPWVPVVKALLGCEFHCTASIVYSRPGSETQEWHTDGAHYGRDVGWDDHDPWDAAAPYALCCFIPLIDLDQEVGFTQFWPGTHTRSGLLGFGGAATLLGCAVDAVVQAGSCIMYDYRLMHRGMPNKSVGTERPLLQLLYHKQSYKETKNYGLKSLFSKDSESNTPE